MTSRYTLKTIAEERDSFNRNLKSAVELGQYPNTGDGLGSAVFDAITEIADAYPETKPELIKKARKAFADYLDWLTSD